MTRGIPSLKKSYSEEVINLSCKRALRFNALGYQNIKKNLNRDCTVRMKVLGTKINFTEGYGHDISLYYKKEESQFTISAKHQQLNEQCSGCR